MQFSNIPRHAALLPLVLALALAGCKRDAANPPANQPAASIPELANAYTSSDYANVAQGVYIAYFGRPADTDGLQNFQAQMMSLKVPADIQQLDHAYRSNAGFTTLIDSFSDSAESAALYSGDNTALVTAIYKNMLNRLPGEDGLKFWLGALDNGSASRSGAAIAILAGAMANTSEQGKADRALIDNKIKVGQLFTTALQNAPKNGYAGEAAAKKARALLAEVTATTDIAAFQPKIDKLVAELAAAK